MERKQLVLVSVKMFVLFLKSKCEISVGVLLLSVYFPTINYAWKYGIGIKAEKRSFTNTTNS